jgi:hypothetical protein
MTEEPFQESFSDVGVGVGAKVLFAWDILLYER